MIERQALADYNQSYYSHLALAAANPQHKEAQKAFSQTMEQLLSIAGKQ
ncbi:MAG: hypothetical protein JKX92_06115 [Porticoccaceae bacterium]|nr:hypothetical protein [Porticoccaceae bacterium]